MQNEFYKQSRDFARAINGIYGGSVKSIELSLNAWRERAQRTRAALLMIKADFDTQKEEADEELSTNRAAQKKAALDAEYNEYVKTAVLHIQVDLDATTDKIRKSYDAAMVRLTDQQIRVLQALSMRSNLTGDELSFYAGALNESLPALRVLSDIAARSGIPFPKVMGVQEFEDSISELQNIYDKYAADIGNDKDDMSYWSILFWRPDTPFREGNLFNSLDNANFMISTAPEVKDVQHTDSEGKKPVKERSKQNDGVMTRLTLDGTEYLETIARQFGTTTEAIKAANPNSDLIHLSKGQVLNIPGTLISAESGSGHVSETSHQMEVVPQI